MRVSLIVAMSEDGVIGRRGELPWHLRADLQRFKSLTMGHTIVMGRKTFESIGRLLPGRNTVVISRNTDYLAEGAAVYQNCDEALAGIDDREVFICGGAAIYRLALPRADCLFVTLVHAHVEGNVYFPPCRWDQWSLSTDERHAADEHNEFDYSFRKYDRLV